ncbi:hypothetical protein ALC57_09290, partial [Trachymyrmex cornetzi]
SYQLADDESSGRPTTATTIDNIEEIHQMIMDNRRIKIREIASYRLPERWEKVVENGGN